MELLPDAKPADRLRLARERAGYDSAGGAARANGWSVGTYRHHENGTRNFPAKVAESYARAYGVSAGWLLGLTERDDRSYAQEIQSQLFTDAEVEMVRPQDGTAAEQFGIAVLDCSLMSALEGNESGWMFDQTFAIDVSVLEQIAPGRSSTPLTFKAIRVDTKVYAREIGLGAVLIIDRAGPMIGRQGALTLYTYAGFAGVSEIFRHPDDTIELMRVGAAESSLRVARKDIQLWGRVAWIGQPPL